MIVKGQELDPTWESSAHLKGRPSVTPNIPLIFSESETPSWVLWRSPPVSPQSPTGVESGNSEGASQYNTQNYHQLYPFWLMLYSSDVPHLDFYSTRSLYTLYCEMLSPLSASLSTIRSSRQALCSSSLWMSSLRGPRRAFRSWTSSLLFLRASSPFCLLFSRTISRGSYQTSSAFMLPLSRRCRLREARRQWLTSLIALGRRGLLAWSLSVLSWFWWASWSWDNSWVKLWIQTWSSSYGQRREYYKKHDTITEQGQPLRIQIKGSTHYHIS